MNTNGKTKKTRISQGVLFVQRHPALIWLGIIGCFLIVPDSSVKAGFWDTLTTPTAWLNALIYPFFLFFSWIVNLAAGIFVWVVDATTFTKLMNAGAIYEVWIVVRDFLNIFFILVLLFSAFATIFQLDKYEYKKTIPTLVIMALLVNFSFPIARFVIDLANVPLYFFAQNVFGTSGFNEITSGILSGTKMQNILIPGVDSKALVDFQTTHLLAATICMFLFGISFLVLAVLMLVRMIALAILVMFSPIGFVGMITPALSSFAKGWWDKLFKWAFYGPIAVMFVLVAVVVMKTAGSSIYPTSGAGGVFQSTGNSVNDNMVSAVAFFAIPIVLFWIAITSTEKYSNDISGLGIKWGSNLGRWGARNLTGYNWGMRRYQAYSAERKRRADAKLADSWFGARLGRLVNSGLDNIRSGVSWGPVGRGGADAARNRLSQEDKRLADEAGKKRGMSDLSDEELRDIVKGGSRAEKAAALIQLAGSSATRDELDDVRKTFGVDSQVTRAFEAKMRAFDPVAVFTDKEGKLNQGRLESFVRSGQIDWKKISDKSLTPELLQYAFKAKTISNKDLDELRSKGGAYVSQIKVGLLGAIQKIDDEIKRGEIKGVDSAGHEVTATNWDNLKDFDVLRNMQMAHLAQTGEFHSAVDTNDSTKALLFQRGDGDSLKRLKRSTIDANLGLMGDNIRGKYVEIISKMAETGDDGLANAKEIKDYIQMSAKTGMTGPRGGGIPVSENLKRLDGLNNDHRIRYI